MEAEEKNKTGEGGAAPLKQVGAEARIELGLGGRVDERELGFPGDSRYVYGVRGSDIDDDRGAFTLECLESEKVRACRTAYTSGFVIGGVTLAIAFVFASNLGLAAGIAILFLSRFVLRIVHEIFVHVKQSPLDAAVYGRNDMRGRLCFDAGMFNGSAFVVIAEHTGSYWGPAIGTLAGGVYGTVSTFIFNLSVFRK